MSSRGSGAAMFLNAALVGTVVLVKTGAVAMSSFFLYNPSNAAVYIRLYDAAIDTDVTNGSTVPDYILAANTLVWAQGQFSKPIQFTKGLCAVACTTAVGSGTTAPNVGAVVNLGLNA